MIQLNPTCSNPSFGTAYNTSNRSYFDVESGSPYPATVVRLTESGEKELLKNLRNELKQKKYKRQKDTGDTFVLKTQKKSDPTATVKISYSPDPSLPMHKMIEYNSPDKSYVLYNYNTLYGHKIYDKELKNLYSQVLYLFSKVRQLPSKKF